MARVCRTTPGEAPLVQQPTPWLVHPRQHVGVDPCCTIECARTTEPGTTFRVAPGIRYEVVCRHAQACRHDVEHGVVDEAFRAVDSKPAVADQHKAKHLAEFDCQRQGRSEAPRGVTTRDLEQAMPGVAVAKRSRNRFVIGLPSLAL